MREGEATAPRAAAFAVEAVKSDATTTDGGSRVGAVVATFTAPAFAATEFAAPAVATHYVVEPTVATPAVITVVSGAGGADVGGVEACGVEAIGTAAAGARGRFWVAGSAVGPRSVSGSGFSSDGGHIIMRRRGGSARRPPCAYGDCTSPGVRIGRADPVSFGFLERGSFGGKHRLGVDALAPPHGTSDPFRHDVNARTHVFNSAVPPPAGNT